MRTLVVSDIHSNAEALDAVLRDAEKRGAIDAIWCTGDIVGYGADPAAVLAVLHERGALCVSGNHDLAACGKMDVDAFNTVAAKAALWTRDTLDDAARASIATLPETRIEGAFTLVHGSLRAPAWEYLADSEAAEAQFALQETRYSIVGHTHMQFWCEERSGRAPELSMARDGDRIGPGEARLIVNPGSVGQPRDGDPRAGYLLYDDAAPAISWHRVEYDVEAAARKILDAGLPEFLAHRLAVGR